MGVRFSNVESQSGSKLSSDFSLLKAKQFTQCGRQIIFLLESKTGSKWASDFQWRTQN
jgi:hypothetical protein